MWPLELEFRTEEYLSMTEFTNALFGIATSLQTSLVVLKGNSDVGLFLKKVMLILLMSLLFFLV